MPNCAVGLKERDARLQKSEATLKIWEIGNNPFQRLLEIDHVNCFVQKGQDFL